MSKLLELLQVLEARAEQVSGIAKFPVWLYPMGDEGRGDLESEVLLKIADHRKISPTQLAEEFIPKMALPEGYAISSTLGYLNVSVPDSEFNTKIEERLYEVRIPKRYDLVLPLPRSGREAEGLRLACSALLQALVLSRSGTSIYISIGKSQFVVGPSDAPWSRTAASFLSKWTSLIGSGDRLSETLQSLLSDSASQTPLSIWLGQAEFESAEFQAIFRSDLNSKPETRVHCPNKEWYAGLDPSFFSLATRGLNEEQALSMTLMLSLPAAGRLLDPESCMLKEKSNPLWYLRSTCDRLNVVLENLGISASHLPLANSGLASEISTSDRQLRHRLTFLPLYQELAGLCGRVGQWTGAMFELLEGFNQFFNRPSNRQELEKFALKPLAGEIISGTLQRLSANISMIK